MPLTFLLFSIFFLSIALIVEGRFGRDLQSLGNVEIYFGKGQQLTAAFDKDGKDLISITKLPILHFIAKDFSFVIKLKPLKNFVSESAIVKLHRDDREEIITEETITGNSYEGDQMAVFKEGNLSSKSFNEADTLHNIFSMRNHSGIEIIDDFFGRFYIEPSKVVAGSFFYKDNLYKLGNTTKASQRQTLNNHLEGRPRVFLAKQAIERKGSNTRRYRCGNDNLHSGHYINPTIFNRILRNTSQKGKMKGKKEGKVSSKLELKIDDDSSTCLAELRTLYVGVVADCSYLEAFNLNQVQARANIINDFNMVSAIYENNFNIQVAIVSIDMFPECASPQSNELFIKPCSKDIKMEERLSSFTKWRKGQSQDAGVYHLVSGCADADVVGIGWLNQVCQGKPYRDSKGNWVGGTSVSAFIKNQFAVIAHELGHNFGAVHDCDTQGCLTCDLENGNDPSKCECCPCEGECDCKGKFVMNPESGGLNVRKFSPCSYRDICKKIPVLGSCLKEPGSLRRITKPFCGDGIKDEGEECDCGGPEKCKGNPCCTVDCKLRPQAKCSDSNDKCCKNCQIISASTVHVCHVAKGPCQRSSMCDGVSASCPKVEHVPDGSDCGLKGSGEKCASGQCTSRSKQCSAIGARLGLSEDCPFDTNSCNIVCRKGDTCVLLDAQYIDGTKCGHAGKCYKGQCSEPIYQTFIFDNSYIVAIAGGASALLIFVWLGKSCIRNTQRRRRNAIQTATDTH